MPPLLAGALRRGLREAAQVVPALATYVIPSVVLVTLLDASGWLQRIAAWAQPAMGWFGLPGDTALALVMGNLLGIYSGLAAALPLGLTARELTILGTMFAISHALVIEAAIVARAGGSAVTVLGARLASAALAGAGLNAILP